MKIAIVEDDINMRKSLEIALGDYPEYAIKTFKNARDALKGIDTSFDLVITDITMPGMDGIEFVKELDGAFDVIVITGNATLSRAIEAMRLGVKDFLTKPFEIEMLIQAIRRSQQLKTKTATKQPSLVAYEKSTQPTPQPPLPTLGTAMLKVHTIVGKAAATDVAMMLLGESGVGKEVFARMIHTMSRRKEGPFMAINMAAIPEALLESELFGYEKGAFTDAQNAKVGRFELAHGGTLFLDEIGEMPYPLQAKLLRALQDKEITRLGGTKPLKIDVRIISATNADIEKSIRDGKFREDLYYRLNAIPVAIPPLRERKEEILPIAHEVIARTVKTYDLGMKSLSSQSEQALLTYSWPGNIRELISVCERATILSDGDMIIPDDLFLESRTMKDDIHSLEKDLLRQALERGGTVFEAAKLLDIPVEVFEKKIDKYGLKGEL